jgi:signal transduction histidine kinase
MTAYRLVQEALSNVIKHAEASVVAVKLIWNVGDSSVQIMVCDDGKGFDTNAQPSGSVGLIGMRERVTAIGGSIRIESNESSGTKVIFGLPLNPPDQRVS